MPLRPRKQARRSADGVQDAVPRVECVVRVLEDDLDAAALFSRPVLRRRCQRGRPSRRTRPDHGSWSPATQRAILVFPLPDSPTRATASPRPTAKDTSLAAKSRSVCSGSRRKGCRRRAAGRLVGRRPSVSSGGSVTSAGVCCHSKQRMKRPGAISSRGGICSSAWSVR